VLNIKKLLNKPEYNSILKILNIIVSVSRKEKKEAYVVGGFVRDLIMKRRLNDIDIMVVGDGINFAKKIADELGIKKIVPFEKFRTALIPGGKIQIEVASARSEVYLSNSRKPSKVNYTDLNGDLVRRDFTINAMALHLSSKHMSKVTDPYNGRNDIIKKILKTPLDPDDTFSEDPLRMMRAAYFSSKLGFSIEEKCLSSIKRQSERIRIVSWERIRDEFIKILQTEKPSIGLNILQSTGIMKVVFPEIDKMYGINQTSEWHHKDIFTHTLQVVDNAAKLSSKMEIRFAALVHDIAKPITRRIDKKKGYTFHGHDAVGERMIKKIALRLKLPNKLKKYLEKLTLLHLRPISLVKDIVTDSAVRRLMVAAGDDLNDLMILCRADITTKNPNKISKYLKNFDNVEKKMTLVQKKDKMKKFQSPIRGKEIMTLFKIGEGKQIGIIKKSIEEAILDGKIENDYDEALAYLETIKIDNINS
jgi:putative nucleotidyltransferase with HDIG domain